MQHDRHRIAIERLFEPARSQERVDFERFAFDCLLDRRIVQERDEMLRAKPRESRFELQCLVDGFADELLDDRFAPGTERALPEAAAEAFDAGDSDAVQLAGVAVEDYDASIH